MFNRPSDRTESDIDQLSSYIASLKDSLFAKLTQKELRRLCSISLWHEVYTPETISM